ncbi:MAG: hypothetical protein ACYCZF_15410 [Anaerolineae bacterium]
MVNLLLEDKQPDWPDPHTNGLTQEKCDEESMNESKRKLNMDWLLPSTPNPLPQIKQLR